jgi:hypothetical protein
MYFDKRAYALMILRKTATISLYNIDILFFLMNAKIVLCDVVTKGLYAGKTVPLQPWVGP